MAKKRVIKTAPPKNARWFIKVPLDRNNDEVEILTGITLETAKFQTELCTEGQELLEDRFLENSPHLDGEGSLNPGCVLEVKITVVDPGLQGPVTDATLAKLMLSKEGRGYLRTALDCIQE